MAVKKSSLAYRRLQEWDFVSSKGGGELESGRFVGNIFYVRRTKIITHRIYFRLKKVRRSFSLPRNT